MSFSVKIDIADISMDEKGYKHTKYFTKEIKGNIRMEDTVRNGSKNYHGIIPPLITPLTKDEKLDEGSLERLIDRCIRSGVHGIFAMGTSGEAMCVGRDVWKRTIEISIKAANNRVPVFCGAIDSSTARVIENIKELEQTGAEAVVVVPAFYIQNTCQSEIIRHIENICKNTPLRIVVYNIPSTTHANILPETIKELAKIDNIVAFKDSSANWEQFQRNIFILEDSRVSLFNGAEELCGASILFGAQGCVPGLANFFPRIFVELYNAGLRKDTALVYSLQKKIWDIRRALFAGKSWVSAMKYIAVRLDLGSGKATSPIEPLTDSEKRVIDGILERHIEK